MLVNVLFIFEMHYYYCKRAKRPPSCVVMVCYFYPPILDSKYHNGHYKLPQYQNFGAVSFSQHNIVAVCFRQKSSDATRIQNEAVIVIINIGVILSARFLPYTS